MAMLNNQMVKVMFQTTNQGVIDLPDWWETHHTSWQSELANGTQHPDNQNPKKGGTPEKMLGFNLIYSNHMLNMIGFIHHIMGVNIFKNMM